MGASGHLGGPMSRALVETGATVECASRDGDLAKKNAADLPSPGGVKHYGVSLNQMDEASLNSGFDSAIEQAGQVDILINNGHSEDAHDLTNVKSERFDKVLKNATAYFLLARRLRDHIVERKATGSVVMIGSMYGVVGSYPDAYEDVCPASPVHYHALKGGIIHMTRHLVVYWAPDGIRVNCLSPGPFPNANAPQGMVERLIKKSPMARMGESFEMKGSLLLLASDAGSSISPDRICSSTADGPPGNCLLSGLQTE